MVADARTTCVLRQARKTGWQRVQMVHKPGTLESRREHCAGVPKGAGYDYVILPGRPKGCRKPCTTAAWVGAIHEGSPDRHTDADTAAMETTPRRHGTWCRL